jgi:hypothetical protein
MQIDYVKISCKENVHICRTNLAKKMERNSHERTSRWKMYGKRLFFEDLEVRDACRKKFEMVFKSYKEDKLANSISGNDRHKYKFYNSLDQWWHHAGFVMKRVSATTMDSTSGCGQDNCEDAT